MASLPGGAAVEGPSGLSTREKLPKATANARNLKPSNTLSLEHSLGLQP